MEALEKDFSGYLLIKGGTDAPNGNKYLHGPAALVEEDGLGSDFDGEDLVKAAIVSGLKTFERLGGQVDWDHLFAKTHDPKHIIGKCVGIQDNPSGGAPIVTTELFMSKALARSAWEHHEAGGVLGYSLQGIAKARDPENSKRITDLEIHMMTLTPNPKGFEGPRLTAGMPLGAIIKGFNAEIEAGDMAGWEAVEEIEPVSLVQKPADIQKSVPCSICANGGKRNESTKGALLGVSPKEIPDGHRYITHEGKAYCADHMSGSTAFGSFEPHEKYGLPDQSFKMKVKKETFKALMAGSGIVQAGESSGAALRTQDLLGWPKPRRNPKTCGCKKSSGSETPCRCKGGNKRRPAARQAEPLNKALVLELTRCGSSIPEAISRQITRSLSRI